MKIPYTWISDAARLLKMAKFSSDARLNPGWLADVDRLLSGVPVPNEDLGFNSPADWAARAAKDDFIRGFSQGYVQARRDVMLTPKDQRRARQAADALERKIDAAISANTAYATAQDKVTALIAKATIAGAQDALDTIKARRGK